MAQWFTDKTFEPLLTLKSFFDMRNLLYFLLIFFVLPFTVAYPTLKKNDVKSLAKKFLTTGIGLEKMIGKDTSKFRTLED